MPNMDVITICEEFIRQEMGNLEDLPREMANTISNVYYNFFLLAKKSSGNSLPKSFRREGNLPVEMEKYLKETAYLSSALESIPKMVSIFREIDPVQQPNSYQMAFDFFLDLFKYKIKNANKKTGLRRMVERKFSKVDEIPGLIDLMDI